MPFVCLADRVAPPADTHYRITCSKLLDNLCLYANATKPDSSKLRSFFTFNMECDIDHAKRSFGPHFMFADTNEPCSFIACMMAGEVDGQLSIGRVVLLLDIDDDGHVDTVIFCQPDLLPPSTTAAEKMEMQFFPFPARLFITDDRGIGLKFWQSHEDTARYAVSPVLGVLLPFDGYVAKNCYRVTPRSSAQYGEFFREVFLSSGIFQDLKKKLRKIDKQNNKKKKRQQSIHNDNDNTLTDLKKLSEIRERNEAEERRLEEKIRRASIDAWRSARKKAPPKPFTTAGVSHKETPRMRTECTAIDVSKRATEKESNLMKLAAEKAERAKRAQEQEMIEKMRQVALDIGDKIQHGE